MRLLITTQAVDLDDPVLAFFHGWIERLAQHFDTVHVVCLKEGRHSLPPHVRVYSLKKETGASRTTYVVRFLKHAWNLRNEYDTVFVHMNPEYIVLAGWLWRLVRKTVTLWYIHPKSSWRLIIAWIFANHIVSATKNSFPFRTRKLIPVGHGIDTVFFTPGNLVADENLRAMVAARLAPVKRIECVVGAMSQLVRKDLPVTLDYYGTALPRDKEYAAAIEKLVPAAVPPGVWQWQGNATQQEIRRAYQTHDVHINATESGSFDKAVFESMACGCITVVSNRALRGIIPQELLFAEGDAGSLALVLERILAMNATNREKLKKQMRSIAEEKYSLEVLVNRITEVLSI